VVNPFDVSNIREGIMKLINEPLYRDELVRRGFENVKRFQADSIAKQYVAIYQELIF